MAEAVMGPLVGSLQDLVMNEAQAMVAVNQDVRNLRDQLMWMEAFLRDANPRRRAKNDELIRVCLQQTRDAVFDAEDAVDQYSLRVDLSRYPSWSRTILKFFTGFTTQLRVRHDLSRRIKSINMRLENIIANKVKYKIDDAGDAPITTWRSSTAISATAEKPDDFVLTLVGRDDKLKGLKNFLIEKETADPMVIYVTGESGVGKTKLVKEIYEKTSTNSHFEVRAWANFAPDVSATNIMKLILQRLTESSVTCHGCEVGQKLHDELSNKNYLLVIDGEVSNTEWKSITSFLPKENAKSRVVRITQMTKREESDGRFKYEAIDLQNFKKEDTTTTKLFEETLLMDKESKRQHTDDVIKNAVDEHAQDIFEVTGGLPLAVVLLSGLLRTKEYPGEWKKVFEHLKGNKSKRLDNILSMCFDDLPHDLKSCFLYFAVFPVNTLRTARTLVCMWMAEGFLRPREGRTMEKVGKRYLNELVHRCLVDLPPLEYAAPGDERVTLQTRVHDFLVLEAQEANFVEIHSGDDIPTLSTARRLSLQNPKDKYVALADPLPKLRSIFSNFEKEEANKPDADETKPNAQPNRAWPFLHRRKVDSKSKDLIRKLLQGSKFLRVISLDGLEIGDKLPSEIGNVVHLQYLGITSCSLREIPPSIGRLTHLQTLDVRGTNVSTLPQEFWRIRTLRHVFGSLFFPKRARHLECLQTLAAIMPDKADGWDKKTLTNMKRLQSLYIVGLTATNMQALSAVCTLEYLVLLIIRGDVISLNLFTSSNLRRLQVMVLKGKIDLEPPYKLDGNHGSSSHPGRGSYGFYLPNLIKLSLKRTKVSQDFIKVLGELPCLATLALFQDSYDGLDLAFTCGFQSLKVLTLGVRLENIVIKKPAFPQVEKLEILRYFAHLNVETDIPDIEEIIKFEDITKRYGASTSKKEAIDQDQP